MHRDTKKGKHAVVSVNLRTQSGINTSRKFNRGEGVSIFGKCTGILGLGEPYTHVRVEVLSSNGVGLFFDEMTTNVFGDYHSYFTFPNVDGRYTIQVTATFTVSGQDKSIVPVSVGSVAPANVPAPEEATNIVDTILVYGKELGIVLIIGAIIYFVIINKTKG